jgi:hypothetical protein
MKRAILISLMLLAFAACETRQASYKDYKAAEEAGEITKGWIPAYLPKSAIDIRIKYDVENNGTWLTFHARVDDISSILNSCQPVSQSDVNYPLRSPARWWPSTLIADARQGIGSYEYYRCKDRAMMALDKKKGEFFYWH